MTDKAILVWRFEDAPEVYRAMSTNGGDEDWIAFVPDALREAWVSWMDYLTYHCGTPEEVEVPGGVIRIWSHT